MEAWIRATSVKGGKNRAKALTAQERKKIAAQGGTAAWKGVSAEDRSARMRKLIEARWKKRLK